LDPALGGETEKATVEWLVEALEQTSSKGQTKLVGYLEEVADEVVFEVEDARGRGYMYGYRKWSLL
jgi:hypothetical protein